MEKRGPRGRRGVCESEGRVTVRVRVGAWCCTAQAMRGKMQLMWDV